MSANKYPLKHYIGVEAAKARIGLQVECGDGAIRKFVGFDESDNRTPLIVIEGKHYCETWIRFSDGKFYDPRHARPLNWLIEVLTPELRKKPEPKEGELV